MYTLHLGVTTLQPGKLVDVCVYVLYMSYLITHTIEYIIYSLTHTLSHIQRGKLLPHAHHTIYNLLSHAHTVSHTERQATPSRTPYGGAPGTMARERYLFPPFFPPPTAS